MMNKGSILGAALLVLSAPGWAHAQVMVGAEDFESYSTGTWDNVSAPIANPQLSGGGLAANIVDSGGTNQELVVDENLNLQYGAGLDFTVPLSGNVSRDINDYEIEFYLRVDPATWSSLTNSGVGLSIFNPNDATQGTEVGLGGVTNYGDAVTNGAVLTVPLAGSGGLTYVPWNKETHIDADIPAWRLSFGSGLGGSQGQVDQPITFILDDIKIHYIQPLLVNPEGSPVGYQSTNSVTVSGTVYDGAAEVETMELHLDGSMVTMTNGYTGGSTTNVITYDAVGLKSGSHIAAVKAYDASGTNSVWYEWTFYVAGNPTPPATTISGLYNINFAHSSHGNSQGLFPVADGSLAAAPGLGSNAWANIDYMNIWWLGDWSPKSIPEASGAGAMANIHFESIYEGMQMYSYFTWAPSTWASLRDGTIWASAMGGADCNMDFELRDLDPSLTYDLYLYFTDPVVSGVTTSTYSLVKGYAPTMSAELLSEQANVLDNSQNKNYVTLTEISPEGGVIRINVQGGSTGGGLSAMQLAVRLPVASVEPTIQSISASGGMVSLTFTSQNHINYAVVGKQRLLDPSWTTITNGIPGGNGGMRTVTFPAGLNREFYMVESE